MARLRNRKWAIWKRLNVISARNDHAQKREAVFPLSLVTVFVLRASDSDPWFMKARVALPPWVSLSSLCNAKVGQTHPGGHSRRSQSLGLSTSTILNSHRRCTHPQANLSSPSVSPQMRLLRTAALLGSFVLAADLDTSPSYRHRCYRSVGISLAPAPSI